MSNLVARAIYYFTETSLENIQKVCADYQDNITLSDAPKTNLNHWTEDFTLTFPQNERMEEVLRNLDRNARYVQISSFALSAISIGVAGYKLVHKNIPQTLLSTVLTIAALYAVLMARAMRSVVAKTQEELTPESIRLELKEMRQFAAMQGPEFVNAPLLLRFFRDEEVSIVLKEWIKREENKLELPASSSSSANSSWTLSELNNQDNKGMQAWIARLETNHPITRALNVCKNQKSSNESFVLDFLKLYNEFLDKELD